MVSWNFKADISLLCDALPLSACHFTTKYSLTFPGKKWGNFHISLVWDVEIYAVTGEVTLMARSHNGAETCLVMDMSDTLTCHSQAVGPFYPPGQVGNVGTEPDINIRYKVRNDLV